ncbi:MAG: D-hexose-6-phosphate mutarotase [Verrucomicrobiota bacterium]
MDTSLEIPGLARLVTGSSGLPRYEITTPLAQAHIYLHGAHVARFVPAGQLPLLWVSTKSCFEPGKPIRGGVPVIFPWFGPRRGDPDAPAHGFARTRSWTLESVVQEPGGAVVVTLRLEPDAATRALWGEPHDWVLRHRITIATALTMELEIENRGSAPFRCEEALHTYFHVSDVRQIAVHGLEAAEYYDNADGMGRKRQAGEPIRFTAETVRTHVHTPAACAIDDPGLNRRILVEKEHSRSTIVWNPWIAKAQAMPDFGDDEWLRMVCVETGNVADNALEIAPGARHVTRTVLRTAPR